MAKVFHGWSEKSWTCRDNLGCLNPKGKCSSLPCLPRFLEWTFPAGSPHDFWTARIHQAGQGACAARGSSKVVTLADIIESDPTRKQQLDTTCKTPQVVQMCFWHIAVQQALHQFIEDQLLFTFRVQCLLNSFCTSKTQTSLISMLILPSMLLRFVSVLYCLLLEYSHTMWRQDQANNI